MPETLPVMTPFPGPTDSAQVRTQLVTSLELEMSGPIPAGDYVEHFDPELAHHRAWFQAVLEHLVAHEPQALEEGGTLRPPLTGFRSRFTASNRLAAAAMSSPKRKLSVRNSSSVSDGSAIAFSA